MRYLLHAPRSPSGRPQARNSISNDSEAEELWAFRVLDELDGGPRRKEREARRAAVEAEKAKLGAPEKKHADAKRKAAARSASPSKTSARQPNCKG